MTVTEDAEHAKQVPRPGMKKEHSACPACGDGYEYWHPMDSGGPTVRVPRGIVCLEGATLYIHTPEEVEI